MEIIKSDILKEKIYYEEYPCGLKVYVMPKPGYDKKYAMFSTHFGSINDKFIDPETNQLFTVPDGVAHFLEHKLFSQKDGNAMDKFASLGASSNAYTSFTHTSYLFSCTEKFTEDFKLLLNFVQNPYITDESVENEKGIIGQEIRMYQDDPDWQVYFNFIDCLYNKFPVKKDIAGTIQTIAGIDKELLYKCFKTFYNLSNMTIFVVGDLEVLDVFSIVEESVPVKQPKVKVSTVYPEEAANVNSPKKEKVCDVAVPLFTFGFKVNPNHNNVLIDEIATNIILEVLAGKSSELYQNLYEEGLITSPLGFDISFEKEYSFFSIAGESSKPETAISKIIEAIDNAKDTGISQEDFARIKKRLQGDYIRQFNSVDKIAHLFMGNIMRGVNILDYADKYNEVTLEDVNYLLRENFNLQFSASSIVKPE